jgi:hypothetical protein
VAASTGFEAFRPFLANQLATAYAQLGSIAFVYCQGSMVENLSKSSDIDIVCVWTDAVPDEACRPPPGIADASPDPVVNDHQESFSASGQEFDVNHVRQSDWDGWVQELEQGSGCSGYPMPVIAAHGLPSGILLLDPLGAGFKLQTRLANFPQALRIEAPRRARSLLPGYLLVLDRCVEESDGLLFHSELAAVARLSWIGWFSARQHYWPLEKRLGLRLQLMGRQDLANMEAKVWSAPDLLSRFIAFRELTQVLLTEMPE